MRTPVSIMTYGVSELSHYLNEQKQAIGVQVIKVDYDYDADIIRIMPLCIGCGLEATERACARVINQIRYFAALQDGKPLSPRDGSSYFIHFFEENGYILTGAPKDLLQQIDKMFIISVDITQNAAPGARPSPLAPSLWGRTAVRDEGWIVGRSKERRTRPAWSGVTCARRIWAIGGENSA